MKSLTYVLLIAISVASAFIQIGCAIRIDIGSPLNQSYPSNSVDFNITLNETGSWAGYSLDGASNVTLVNSTGKWWATNTSMAEGYHSVMFYANDTAGNMNVSAPTIYFTVDVTKPFIGFIPLTDANNSYADRNWIYINTSISDNLSPNNLTAFIDFNRSLVGWWRFNREAGENDTFVRDWSSYGNNGTLYNTNPGIDNCTENCSGWTTSGMFGNAMNFDGKDDYVDVGNSNSININGDMTIMAWIKPMTWGTAGSMRIVGNWIDSTGGYVFYLSSSSSRIGAVFADGFNSYAVLAAPNSITLEQWQHVVVTENRTTGKIYVNGILSGSPAVLNGLAVSTYALWIGDRSGDVGSRSFNGTIDEVKVWKRALSEEEINASYNVGLYRLYHNFTNLTEGTYTYIAYAQDIAGNINQTETRTLTVDKVAPDITIQSPLNETYTTSSIDFRIVISETGSWVAYSLDGAANVSMANQSGSWNAQKTILANGQHYVVFYAKDLAGNLNASNTVYFTLNRTFLIDQHSVLYRIYSDDISALSFGQKYAASNMPNTSAFAVVAYGIMGAIPGDPKLIVVNQSLASNNINLVFTKGVWSSMAGRVDMLGSIEFDKYVSPSFGYPLKKDYAVMVGADYSKKSINILNDMHLYPGMYVFNVQNMGFRNKKSLINLTVQRMS